MVKKHNILVIVFSAISISSAFLLITSTYNYVEFYKALRELNLQLLEVNPSVGNTANLTLFFLVSNPTSYVGLRLREISFVLSFEYLNNKVELHFDTVSFAKQPLTIDPYWNKTFELFVQLDMNRKQTMSFIEFYKSQPQKIVWTLDTGAILITFVGKVDVPMTATLVSNL